MLREITAPKSHKEKSGIIRIFVKLYFTETMHRILLPIYRYFKEHKWLMYLCLFGSLAVFAFFGAKLRYFENNVQFVQKEPGV